MRLRLGDSPRILYNIWNCRKYLWCTTDISYKHDKDDIIGDHLAQSRERLILSLCSLCDYHLLLVIILFF